jgi:hypothetical protein
VNRRPWQDGDLNIVVLFGIPTHEVRRSRRALERQYQTLSDIYLVPASLDGLAMGDAGAFQTAVLQYPARIVRRTLSECGRASAYSRSRQHETPDPPLIVPIRPKRGLPPKTHNFSFFIGMSAASLLHPPPFNRAAEFDQLSHPHPFGIAEQESRRTWPRITSSGSAKAASVVKRVDHYPPAPQPLAARRQQHAGIARRNRNGLNILRRC